MIKGNSRFFMICCVVVLFLLIWSVFLRVWHNTESRCTVKAERNLFSVIMEFMNESKSEAFQLEEGASLVVYIEHLDGELDIFITDSIHLVSKITLYVNTHCFSNGINYGFCR